MKTLKLTELQKHKLRVAFGNMSDVLREIKQNKLESHALKDMQCIEQAVQMIEVVML